MAESWKMLMIDDEESFAENLQTHFHRFDWVARIAGAGSSAEALQLGKFPTSGGLCVTAASRDKPTDCAWRTACAIR